MAFDEDLANRIREVIGAQEGIREQRMFGGLVFLVNGNISVGVMSGGRGLLVRAPPEELEALTGKPYAAPARMGGRLMRGWLTVEEAGLRERRQLERWVRRGLDYAGRLPPKEAG